MSEEDVSPSESSSLSDTGSLTPSDESETDSESEEEEAKNKPSVDTKDKGEESDEFSFDDNAGGSALTGLGNKPLSSTREDEAKTSYVKNATYDEAMELDESVNSVMTTATTVGGTNKPGSLQTKSAGSGLESKVQNDKYDEALELSETGESMNTVDTSTGDVSRLVPTSGGKGSTNQIANRNYDEVLELSSDTVNTVDTAAVEKLGTRGKNPRDIDELDKVSESSDMTDSDSDVSNSNDSDERARKTNARQNGSLSDLKSIKATSGKKKVSDSSGSDSDSGTESSSEEKKEKETRTTSVDTSKYDNLPVSEEIKELFDYIGAFKPTTSDLDSKLKCFIPDYIPSIGEMDPFLKIHRPGGQKDELGLKVLDEPSAQQSERTVLELQLRAQTKRSGLKEVKIQSIECAEKNPAAITAWIENMQRLHQDKPRPTVTYKKSMPDIEQLMQVWPSEFEDEIKSFKLPAEIDLSTKEYASVVCALLDVPIHESTVQSLHVLFTLYAEFKANQHFMNLGGDDGEGDAIASGGSDVLNLDETVPEDEAEESTQNFFMNMD